MTDQDDLKAELLKVQVSTAGDNRGPVSLLEQILDILQQSNCQQYDLALGSKESQMCLFSSPQFGVCGDKVDLFSHST